MKKPHFKHFFLLLSVFSVLLVAGVPAAMANSTLAVVIFIKKAKKRSVHRFPVFSVSGRGISAFAGRIRLNMN